MIQLVIEIDEELYKKTKDGYLSCIDALGVCEFVSNGKPLPKGHGRLIDVTKLEDIIQEKGFISPLMNPVFGMMQVFEMIDDVPTVIEADEEEGVEV